MLNQDVLKNIILNGGVPPDLEEKFTEYLSIQLMQPEIKKFYRIRLAINTIKDNGFKVRLENEWLCRVPKKHLTKKELDFLEENIQAQEKRAIWANILTLDTLPIISSPCRPEEVRKKMSHLFMFSDYNKKPRRFIRECYWYEAYNRGRYTHNTEYWFNVWRLRKTGTSFVKWCERVGIKETGIAYYNPEERHAFRVYFDKGLLIDCNELVLDTSNQNFKGLADFVMSPNKEIYCYATTTAFKKKGIQHHSSLLSGQPVLFAGELKVSMGNIEEITMTSGHYQPTKENLIELLKVLKSQNISLNKVKLYEFEGNLLSDDAELFLSSELDERTCPQSP